MKVRNGFVSNSSSSSFICEVCGRIESGWDSSLYDVEMVCCSNGHEFCTDHLMNMIKKSLDEDVMKKIIDKLGDFCPEYVSELTLDGFKSWYMENIYDSEFELEWGVPEELCPICTFTNISDSDASKYLTKLHPEVLVDIRNKFSNYKEFRKFIS